MTAVTTRTHGLPWGRPLVHVSGDETYAARRPYELFVTPRALVSPTRR
jgi:hypothetical protein